VTPSSSGPGARIEQDTKNEKSNSEKVEATKKSKKEKEAKTTTSLDEINETMDAKPRFFEGNEKEKQEEDTQHLFDDEDIPMIEPSKVQLLLSQFTPEQNHRYEYYRRSNFPKANVKNIMQSVSGTTINQKMAIVMSGITKLFVGEIIETARTVQDEWEDIGAIRPRHIREAYRRLQQAGKIPYAKGSVNSVLFKR